jgi:hypothetical protein
MNYATKVFSVKGPANVFKVAFFICEAESSNGIEKPLFENFISGESKIFFCPHWSE